MRITEKLLPAAKPDRRHSSSTASADESNREREPAPATTADSAWVLRACVSMRTQAPAWSCVISAGRTSISLYPRRLGPPYSAFLGVRLVAFGQAGDQAIQALGVDLGRELAAIGLHQPHTHHVQVVDLPACALARSFLEPVVQLD